MPVYQKDRVRQPSIWERGAIPTLNGGPSSWYLPEDRLRQLEAEFQQFPGSAPGGSGATGLLPNDAQGWSDLLNRQSEYAQLRSGKPLNVELGERPKLESMNSLSRATGENNREAFGLPASWGGAELKQLGTGSNSMKALRRFTGGY